MTSLSTARIKDLARLAQKRYRREAGLVVVEGERCLAQLAESGAAPRELYLAPGAPQDHPIHSLVASEHIFAIQQHQLERITRSKQPQPICALYETVSPLLPEHGRLLYLDDVRDPGNLGAVLRTALALGVDGVALSPESCEPWNPKAIQSALGAPFVLPCQTREPEWVEGFAGAVFAAHMHGASLRETPAPSGDVLLVIGGEAHGVSERMLRRADLRVSIPLSGRMESLNAAVAAGILMEWMTRG